MILFDTLVNLFVVKSMKSDLAPQKSPNHQICIVILMGNSKQEKERSLWKHKRLRKKLKIVIKVLNQKKNRKKKISRSRIHQVQMENNPKLIKKSNPCGEWQAIKQGIESQRHIYNFQALKMSVSTTGPEVAEEPRVVIKENSHFSWSHGRWNGPSRQKEKN